MSQRDVVAELHAVRLEAPAELRARIRLLAGAPEPPRRPRVTWRRALVVALPVAAAVAAAGVVVGTRPSREHRAAPAIDRAVAHGSASTGTRLAPQAKAQLTVPSAKSRVQRVDETLALRVDTPKEVSDGVKRALRIAASLGGYPASVHASSRGAASSASLVLKIPRVHVQAAVARLSELGTIVSEHVDVQDLQSGLNATDRTIARLQRQLKALRAEVPPPAPQILALERRIATLQRAEAATRLKAHYATLSLRLSTPPKPAPAPSRRGPLHGVVVGLTWLGIGAVYALAIGGPLVLLALAAWFAVRLVRRRREDALLSRP
jgi:hypothetical protein